MASKEKKAGGRKKAATERRALGILPTSTWSLSESELSELSFKPGGMAETVVQALSKHGVGAGEARKRVIEQVKVKFPEARDSTIRTQTYRGIAYLRATGRTQKATTD